RSERATASLQAMQPSNPRRGRGQNEAGTREPPPIRLRSNLRPLHLFPGRVAARLHGRGPCISLSRARGAHHQIRSFSVHGAAGRNDGCDQAVERPGEVMHSLALLLLGILPAAERDFAAALESEAARVQRESREIREIDPSMKDSKSLLDSFLGRTSEALKAHRYYVGLEDLGRARGILNAMQPVRDNAPAIETVMHGFESE